MAHLRWCADPAETSPALMHETEGPGESSSRLHDQLQPTAGLVPLCLYVHALCTRASSVCSCRFSLHRTSIDSGPSPWLLRQYHLKSIDGAKESRHTFSFPAHPARSNALGMQHIAMNLPSLRTSVPTFPEQILAPTHLAHPPPPPPEWVGIAASQAVRSEGSLCLCRVRSGSLLSFSWLESRQRLSCSRHITMIDKMA